MRMGIYFLAEQISVNATPFFPNHTWLTNSLLVTVIVAALLLVWARSATAKMELVPSGRQNVFETIVEALYTTFEGIVGRHMIAKTFPLIATLFVFILAANWFGLVPGVGTIGFGPPAHGPLALEEVQRPLLRPSNADLNMTLGMALFFMIWWVIWTVSEVGVIGFLKENFAPKGGMKGAMWFVLLPLFIFTGIIEIISIIFRPISLSLRLFGNIYAGETLLHTMSELGSGLPIPLNFITSVLFPLPFYFLELLVGILQAFVFALLCAVYIRLSTTHPEGEGEGAHGH
jgi:F-type H+-transporting ATPase subunit a